MEPENRKQVDRFYMDESLIEIEGRPHVLVCAVNPHDPETTAVEIVRLKECLGFGPLDEVKSNTPGITRDIKIKITDGVLEAIGGCTVLISILEGLDKQEATEMAIRQVVDFCVANRITGYALNLDRDIAPNKTRLEALVRGLSTAGPACIGLQYLDSSKDQNVQLTDLFLGQFRLAMLMVLGDRAIYRPVYMPAHDAEMDWPLSDYVTLFSRGSIWGRHEVRVTEIHEEYGEITHPYHCSFGLGIRLESSISGDTKQIIEEDLATTYMGCLS